MAEDRRKGDPAQPNTSALSTYPVPHYVSSPRTLALAATAGLLVLGAILAIPEQSPDYCLSPDRRLDLCYCEAFHDGLVRQPANALSGLAFPLAGIAMLWKTPRVEPGALARFHRDKRIHLLWALTCIVLGPASVAFHATFQMLTGLFDNLAVLVWMSLFNAYHLGRALAWRGNRILATFAAMTVGSFGASLASIALFPRINGPHLVAEVGAVGVALAPAVVYRRHGFPGWRSERWLLAAFGCALVAGVTVKSSGTGGPWCLPESWLQGHAVFHVLCAVSIWLTFEHARRTSP